MPVERGVDDVAIWQNHENRITTIEVNQENISQQMNGLERVVKEESNEQKVLLNRLIEHHLETNKIRLSQFWKVVLNLTGGASILGVIVYAAIQFLSKLGG